jgi:hypothetical protein
MAEEGAEVSASVDEAKLGEFMGQMVRYMTGGALCFSVWLGEELGLYRAMDGAGPRYARDHLEPGGTVLLVEPFALDAKADNLRENPMAALMYTASSAICTPNSLSQEVALGLGAQAGEARLRRVFDEAGYTHFRRAAETRLNLILEARP